MAKKSMKTFDDFKLISVWLTDKEKIQYEEWAGSVDANLLDWLVAYTDYDWKFSISQDQQQGVPVISLTCKRVRSAHKNRVYMFRHKDHSKALAIAYFYWDTVLDRGDVETIVDDSLEW